MDSSIQKDLEYFDKKIKWLRKLEEEVREAIRQFEKDKAEGKLKPIDDSDETFWC